MNIHIEDYTLGNKVVSLALDEYAYETLKFRGLETIFFNGTEMKFWPEEILFSVSEDNREKIMTCENFDVFQLSSDGNLYLYYDNKSTDNAIITTLKCNSNCIMCPIPENVRKKECSIDEEEILRLIKHFPSDAEHITISGGEPFLIGEKIFEIFAALKQQCPCTEILLLTNGRALAFEPYFQKFCETIPCNILVGIPIHGSDKYKHNMITRSSGAFEQTFLGIKRLIKEHFLVEIRIVVSKLNMNDIFSIAQLIIKEFSHVHSVKIMGLEMLGSAFINQNEVWIKYSEAFQCSKEAIKLLIKNGIDVALYNFPLCAVEKEYHYICCKSITDYKIRYNIECDQCRLKDACGGVFAGTLKMAEKDFKAWR